MHRHQRLLLLTGIGVVVCLLGDLRPAGRFTNSTSALGRTMFQSLQEVPRAIGPRPLYAQEAAKNHTASGSKSFSEIAATIFGGDITPERAVCDPYPEFNGIAVDPTNNLAVFSAPNLKRLVFYDRRAGSDAPGPTPSLGMIGGQATRIAGESGVAMDPVRHQIYSVDTDIGNTLVAFSYADRGNAAARILAMPVGAYGVSLSQRRREMVVTNEDDGVVMIFRLGARGVANPLREIRGAKTGLAEPKGIFWDDKHHEIIVENEGDINRGKWDADYTGGGRYNPPSITVYSDQAKNDAAPLRTIQGPKTQLNDPVALAVDELHNEIFVVNIGSNSVTVYDRGANGDVAPVRILKGVRTQFRNPIGVAVDPIHDELWVANFGHTAEIFARTARGDAAPERIIRSAPAGTPSVGVVLPQALAFDSKRDQLLVGH
ncbi:MAG: hypothetical protein IVW54_19635 [Candidatus Binataceae bacterium]|nr:hypothetical protein [Candidatus Binataceae bacterium]